MSDVETITQDLEVASDGKVPEQNLGVIRRKIEQAMVYSFAGLERKMSFFYKGLDHPDGWKIENDGITFTPLRKQGASVTYRIADSPLCEFRPTPRNNIAPWDSMGHSTTYLGIQEFTDAALQDIIAGRNTWEHVVGYLKRTHALLDEKMQAIGDQDYDAQLPEMPPTEAPPTE